MGNKNPNSTNYVHSYEPNTGDLTMAMDYTSEGKPALRVLSNIQGDITIDGDVTIPGEVTVVQNEADNLNVHARLFDESDTEYSESNPLTIDGTVTIQDGGGSISIDDGGNVITVDGTVNVGNFPATQTVDGTVNIGTLPEVEIKNDTGNPISVIGTITNPFGNSVVTVDDDTVQNTSTNRSKVSNYEFTEFNTFQYT